MKQSKCVFAVVIAAMGVLFAGLASAAGPYARTLNQVDAIWVDSNVCMSGLSEELSDHGFMQPSSPRAADAVLDVTVHQLDASFGTSARYTATLVGDDGRVLFTTTGREDSLSQQELCMDISDDIFDRIQNRMG